MVNGAKLINNIGKATEKHKIMKIKIVKRTSADRLTFVIRFADERQQIVRRTFYYHLSCFLSRSKSNTHSCNIINLQA